MFMSVMIHMMKYLRKIPRKELNHDEFILEGEVEISDDEIECNEDLFSI